MKDVRVLIVAAGKGTRSGLNYPKTLYPVQGQPILVRILNLMVHLDPKPTVIVSPSGHNQVWTCIKQHDLDAVLVDQESPVGMGDAVLRYRYSPRYKSEGHVVLIWGDIPFIQRSTLESLLHTHFVTKSDFTFATALVEESYTIVDRNGVGEVVGVRETREEGIEKPGPGERDIGLFVFRCHPVMELLSEDNPERFGKKSGEHGFLYVVRQLARRGYVVTAVPIATDCDLISLNQISDLGKYAT